MTNAQRLYEAGLITYMRTDSVNLSDEARKGAKTAMVEKAKSGQPGGAMGGADFINVLYSEFLNFDPSDLT